MSFRSGAVDRWEGWVGQSDVPSGHGSRGLGALALVAGLALLLGAGSVQAQTTAVPATGIPGVADGARFIGAHAGLSGVGSAAAIGLNGEMFVRDQVSVGAWFDTWSYGDQLSSQFGSTSWNVRYVSLAGTGAWHFPLEDHPKWDPYVGGALGYFVVRSETSHSGGISYSGDSNRMFLGGFAGARYLHSERLSGTARIGFGAAYLTLGIGYRL